MATGTTARREPLTAERVLGAALVLADEHGLEAVSMRRVGRALGVEAMSLYKHVADKEAILNGVADLVTGEFEVPTEGHDWKQAIRRSTLSAHDVLRRHPWASVLIESRLTAGPARLRYLEATMGVLRGAGFTMATVLRAIMAIDSYVYGFTLQETAWPIGPEEAPESAAALARLLPPDAYPHMRALAEMVASTPGGAAPDFEFGLDLLLDGLERLRAAG